MQVKKPQFCILCNKNLKFKYKPDKSWNIPGFLCSDCHMKTTEEFVIKQKEEEAKIKQRQNQCFICNAIIDGDQKKNPRWQWGFENDVSLCKKCYDKKESDYQTKINFCVKCGKKIGFFRYNPKPKWQIDGQLCRKCWDMMNDSQNS